MIKPIKCNPVKSGTPVTMSWQNLVFSYEGEPPDEDNNGKQLRKDNSPA
jgi:hypothetical protein